MYNALGLLDHTCLYFHTDFKVGAESEETFAAAEILLKNMGAKVSNNYRL